MVDREKARESVHRRDQGQVQLGQNGAKRLLSRNGCVLNTVLMTQELQLQQLRRSFFVFFLKSFRSLKHRKVSLHNTIAKYINMWIFMLINQCLHLPNERIWTRRHCNHYDI